MAILLVIMVGILSSIAFAYTSSTDTELRNTAKNVASYTLEYQRARTVTRGNTTLYNLVNPTGATTGTFAWYDTAGNPNGAMPSMLDVGNLPLQSNRYPCNYTSTYVRTGSKVDGNANPADTNGGTIWAGSQTFSFASKHAASPTQTYQDQPLAFTTTLQGYVSVQDIDGASSTQNPAPEDKNLAEMRFSASNTASGTYRTRLLDLTSTGAWTNLVVRYPGVYPSTAPLITSFTAGSTYLPKVYTTDAAKVTKTSQAYNPYYTNVAADRAATQNYRGFRILTQLVARTAAPLTYAHVQYYDVTVTVLWMNGTRESSYELVSRIVTY